MLRSGQFGSMVGQFSSPHGGLCGSVVGHCFRPLVGFVIMLDGGYAELDGGLSARWWVVIFRSLEGKLAPWWVFIYAPWWALWLRGGSIFFAPWWAIRLVRESCSYSR